MFASAHALLVPTLAMAIYFTGFALLSLLGAVLQDRKLLRRHGDAYARYLDVTSLLPFVAILQGRQRLAPGEGLLRRSLIAAGVATLLGIVHPWLAAFNAAPLAGVIALGGAFVSARRWRQLSPSPLGEGLG